MSWFDLGLTFDLAVVTFYLVIVTMSFILSELYL